MGSVRGRPEDGFTLVEVLVAVLILGLIMAPLTAAVILAFKTQGSVAERLTTSQGRFLLDVYLPRDAMEASQAYGSGSGAISFANTCADQSLAQSADIRALVNPSVQLVLTWNAQTATSDSQGHVSLTNRAYEVDYVVAIEPGHAAGQPTTTAFWLWRFAFTATQTYSSTQAASGCTLVAGSATLVTRDITEATGSVTDNSSGQLSTVALQYTDSTGNSYTATGGARL